MDPLAVIAGQMGFVVTVSATYAVLAAIMVGAAPPALRCTTIALGYNISLGTLGGMSPLAAAWLVQRTGLDLSPAFMVMAAAAISIVAVLSLGPSKKPAAAAESA